jgi:hypothetical protein
MMLVLVALHGPAAEWVRPGLTTNQPVWGLREGLRWAIYPGGFLAGGPRGLIRLGYPVLPGGSYDLINFIAIEPVVKGRRGFSELERSQADRLPGKRIWAEESSPTNAAPRTLVSGELTRRSNGVEQLTVALRVEPFENGAHVWLAARQRSDRPDELELQVRAEPDSAALDYCTLTATMGNKARTRLLWLEDEVVSSLKLYPDYTDRGFAPHTVFPLNRLHRTARGDLLVALTNDEPDPAIAEPPPKPPFWRYRGFPVTQYWRKPAGAFQNDLHVAVNARYTYWMSPHPIPGGIAFENFEMRERFYDGQTFIFGITRKQPRELGFREKF